MYFTISGLPDQSINFADFDVVQFLDSRFNLVLVGLQVADKNQSIVIFNLLHGRLCGQGVFDYVLSIHAVPARSGLARILGSPGRPERFRPVELHTRPDLLKQESQLFKL